MILYSKQFAICGLACVVLSGCVTGAIQRVVGTAPPKPVEATAAAQSMPSSTSVAIAQCAASAQGGKFDSKTLAAAGFSSSDFNPRELTLKLPDGQGYSVTYPTKGAGGCKLATTYPAFAQRLFAQSLSELKLQGYDLRDDGPDTYTASNGQQTLFVSGGQAGGAGSPRFEININPAS